MAEEREARTMEGDGGLAAFLRARGEQILVMWTARVRTARIGPDVEDPILRDHIPAILDMIARCLEQRRLESCGLDRLPDAHALDRLEVGFDLHAVALEYALLRATVLELWRDEVRAPLDPGEVLLFSEAVDHAVTAAVTRYAHARERTLRGLDTISSAALADQHVDGFLGRLLDCLHETTPVIDSAAVYIAEGDAYVVRAAVGVAQAHATGMRVERGHCVAGRVAEQRATLRIDDPLRDPRVESPAIVKERTSALLGVPLLIGDEVGGVVVVGTESGVQFSEEDELVVRSLASRAAALLALARSRDEERRALRGERRALEVVEHGDACFVLDRDWRIVLVNAAQEALSKKPRSATLGRVFWDVWPETRELRYWREYHRARDERVVVRFEEYFAPLDLWTDVTASPTSEGGIAVVFRDVSERKRAEAALRESEETLRVLVEGAPDTALYLLDAEGRVASWNEGARRLAGYEAAEVVGRHYSMFFTEEDRAAAVPERLLEEARAETVRLARGFRVCKDGRRFFAEATLTPILEGGALRGYAHLTRDVGERRAQELERERLVAELERERGHLAARLELSRALAHPGIDVREVLARTSAHLVEAICDLCIVRLAAPDGTLPVAALRHRDPEEERRVAALLRDETIHVGEAPVGRVVESGVPLLVPVVDATRAAELREAVGERLARVVDRMSIGGLLIVPLRAHGRSLGSLALVRGADSGVPFTENDLALASDLGDRVALAIENARLLQEAQDAARVREEVLGVVSHDLRNPLNAITIISTALLKREDLDVRTMKALGRLYSAADRAGRMIRDLLDFTRARVGGVPLSPRAADLRQIAREVLDELSLVHPDRRMVLEARGDLVGEWDPDRLAQLLQNLAGNALEHAPEDVPARVTLVDDGDVVRLEVENEGVPIPPALQERLFEPFQRGDRASSTSGGVGLGLFISKRIVDAHGGAIAVRSNAEEGTRFTVTLPRRAPAPPDVPPRRS